YNFQLAVNKSQIILCSTNPNALNLHTCRGENIVNFTYFAFIKDAAVAPPTKKVIAPKLPVKIKKTPLLFQGESQELQCEIVNISEQRVIITVGSCSSPLFELVKPTVHKFYIDPQYSVRLSIRCRMENAPRESNEKELSATLILNCALESDRSNKQKISIPMKAIL
ncbi:unnamed protein product, partial [Hymenolepis diminuta]